MRRLVVSASADPAVRAMANDINGILNEVFLRLGVAKSYAVADLPSSGVTVGSFAFATDGRKNGEASSAGSGVFVFHDGSNWIAADTGATVAA